MTEPRFGAFPTDDSTAPRESSAEERPLDSTATLADLTAETADLRRRLARLEVELRRARTMVEVAADAIFVIDLDGHILDTNQRACDSLGYTREELLQRRVSDIDVLAPSEPEDLNTASPMVEGVSTVEGLHRRKDGSTFPVEVRTTEITSFGQDLRLSVARDIAQYKQTEEALQQAKEAAESANRSKGDFLARMSHEIRTPMNGVIGMAGLLLETSLDPKQQQFTETIQHSSELLLTIIDDILDFSKVEAGMLELEQAPFDLRWEIRSAADLLAQQARRKGIALELDVSADLPSTVVGDCGRLRQVLVNLLANAVKFTETGGVTLRVRRLGCDPGPARIHFEVADTGIGIPLQRLASIFQPFEQADVSTSRNFGGTGLGLAICSELVTLMGGTLDASSEPGVGSTFAFAVDLVVGAVQGVPTIPEVPQAEAAALSPRDTRRTVRKESPRAERPTRSRTILVVEDNVTNQWVARHLLERLGHMVELVGTGAEALDALAQRWFDLVLMDCQMPELDGYEATRRIRVGCHQPDIPIVAMTAHAMRGDREQCLAAGMDDYLAKPVDRKVLESVLGHWLRFSDRQRSGPPEPLASADAPSTSTASQFETESPSGERVDGTEITNTEIAATEIADTEIAATEIADTEIVDAEIFTELATDRDLARQLVTSFDSDSRQLLTTARRALEADDPATARQAAHTLKGSSASIGGQALSQQCAVFLQQTGSPRQRLAGVEGLELELDRLLRVLGDWLDR